MSYSRLVSLARKFEYILKRADLKDLEELGEYDPEVEDARKIMEGKPSQGDESGRHIKSHYKLWEADIYYTHPAYYYSDFGLFYLIDDLHNQKVLSRIPYPNTPNASALIIFPGADLLVDYDGKNAMGWRSKEENDIGPNPSAVGAEEFSVVKSYVAEGSLLTNKEFAMKAREHGYNWSPQYP